MTDLANHLKVANQFLQKADGKDKLTALVQYACMFISAGEAGNAKKIQASVAAARKVFRILRPLEALTPVLTNPGFSSANPSSSEILGKLKCILNAIYFGADHVVWASQAGLLQDKALVDRFQKASLYGWFGASLCTVVSESLEIIKLSKIKRKGEDDEAWRARQMKAVQQVNDKLFVLVHALVQAFLAIGLLGLRPWKPRTVGLLGVIASVMNCYMLYPALPSPAKAVEALKGAALAAPRIEITPPKIELKKA